MTNKWNTFLRKNGGYGLSMPTLSKLYKIYRDRENQVLIKTPIPIINVRRGTCLVRGKSHTENNSNKRFFGYYGLSHNRKNFCKSKKFVTKYAKAGFEYIKVAKDLKLVDMPYANMVWKSGVECEQSKQIAKAMYRYCSGPVISPIVIQLGLVKVVSAIFESVLGGDVLDGVRDPELREIIRIGLGAFEPGNPDYVLAKLVCEMGFQGWVRRESVLRVSDVDELFICNLQKLTDQGVLVQDGQCNLDQCDG